MVQQLGEMFTRVEGLVQNLEQKHQDIAAIKEGPAGAPGIPGKSVDHASVVADVLAQMPKPADGKSPKVEAIASALVPLMVQYFEKTKPKVKEGKPGVDAKPVDTALLLDQLFEEIKNGKRKLSVGHIDGLDTKFAEVRNAAAMGTPSIYGKNTPLRGGGDTVVAGTGVTIVETVNGNKQISAVAVPLTIITITGAIDDSNVTFTAASEPLLLNINGAFYQKTGGAYTWTYVAGTITLNNPVGTSGTIFGI